MFPWLQQTFVGEEDCVTSPKSVCVGGYTGGSCHFVRISKNFRPKLFPKIMCRKRNSVSILINNDLDMHIQAKTNQKNAVHGR